MANPPRRRNGPATVVRKPLQHPLQAQFLQSVSCRTGVESDESLTEMLIRTGRITISAKNL